MWPELKSWLRLSLAGCESFNLLSLASYRSAACCFTEAQSFSVDMLSKVRRPQRPGELQERRPKALRKSCQRKEGEKEKMRQCREMVLQWHESPKEPLLGWGWVVGCDTGGRVHWPFELHR